MKDYVVIEDRIIKKDAVILNPFDGNLVLYFSEYAIRKKERRKDQFYRLIRVTREMVITNDMLFTDEQTALNNFDYAKQVVESLWEQYMYVLFSSQAYIEERDRIILRNEKHSDLGKFDTVSGALYSISNHMVLDNEVQGITLYSDYKEPKPIGNIAYHLEWDRNRVIG